MPVDVIGWLAVTGLAIAAVACPACASCPEVGHKTLAQGSRELPVPDPTDNTPRDAERAAAAAERLATETCACATSSCADTVSSDFVAVLRAAERGTASALASHTTSPALATRVLGALEKVLVCRDRLAYPEDPVDLEAGSAGLGDASGAAR